MNIERIEQHGFKLLDLVEETSRVCIWRAVQTMLDRTVLLVILNEEAAADPLETGYFLQIAQHFAKLKSESLAAIFDIVSADDLHYAVLEHVEGKSIDEMLQQGGSLDFKHLMQVALSVTGALKQLWNHFNIIHRNIKGSTIRFDARGIAKITDFSLAIIASPDFDVSVIDKGHVLGAPPFLSPEQSRGDEVISTGSDMYALGALLYYAATGKAPFAELDAPEILNAHLRLQLTPPHLLKPALPPLFSRLLHKLMMKKPEHRYRNWEEVQHDLHCIVNGREPVCASTDLTRLSTIEADFSAQAQSDTPPPTFKIKPKKRNQYLSSMRDRHVMQHHEADEKNQRAMTQLLWWSVLMVWFAALFWYRTVLQIDPLRRQELRQRGEDIGAALEELIPLGQKQLEPELPAETPDMESDGATNALDISEEQVAVVARSATPDTPSATPDMPSATLDTIAAALAANDISAAIAAMTLDSQDYPQREALIALLQRVPSAEQIVAKHLLKNIDQPLVLNFKGVPRKVIPRAVKGHTVQLEANERSVNLDISTLTTEQKLNWIEKPVTVEEHIATAMLQLQSSEPAKAASYAAGCGALAGAVERAIVLLK
ncbi:MAG: serine/threonine-protein kinase [Kiritimatiellae bacterium]|nr:serine/threonine-protein kinase [Kiritimatiellia bacterium]